ncbi:E3 ubiquitin-protein ligase rnf8-A-like isoform X2 [Daktulosphaira vitifoliae]|uniref:E3 ubiquitin-protein ligase rnf8-A-like isoform X2 n=1 Tax=Daktulosphaira vitifoliae TaxID=58002 RepID=UPI0021AA716B|nr:E3 ubiquitin-protein ligase rnf8-A-like isoform X2 [Daktulosphaira vitifoliae]
MKNLTILFLYLIFSKAGVKCEIFDEDEKKNETLLIIVDDRPDCCICMQYKEEKKIGCCGHSFCCICINRLFVNNKYKCAICRKEYTTEVLEADSCDVFNCVYHSKDLFPIVSVSSSEYQPQPNLNDPGRELMELIFNNEIAIADKSSKE